MKKEILMIFYANPDTYPPIMNSIEILAADFRISVLCRNLGEANHVYPPEVEIERAGGPLDMVQHRQLSAAGKIMDYFRFILRAFFLSRKRKPALLYAHDMHGLIPAVIASAANGFVPVIYHNHDLPAEGLKGFSRFVEAAQYPLARHCSLVVFPEIHRAAWFRRKARLGSEPVIVWNTPMRLNNLPAGRLKTLLKSRECRKPVLIYQGQIGPSQGLEAVVGAFSKRSDCSLVLLGRAWNPQYIDKLFALAGARRDRLFYAGEVPYRDVLSFTVDADIGIALYEKKDFNRENCASASCKIFEYFAAGLPVLMSDFPVFREFFAEIGSVKFATPGDVESIGASLDELLGILPQLQTLKAEARRLHLEKYHYEKCFEPVRQWIKRRVPS